MSSTSSSSSSPTPSPPLDPENEKALELARKIRELWLSIPRQMPPVTETPTQSFQFYISWDNGDTEHTFDNVTLTERTAEKLKEALERFSGHRLNLHGIMVLVLDPMVKMLVDNAAISRWDNGQFFLLEVSDPNQWELKFIET